MFNNLEAELRRKKITRATLATGIGLSMSALSAKLNNKNQFTIKEAWDIKSFLDLNIPIDELFKLEETKTKELELV